MGEQPISRYHTWRAQLSKQTMQQSSEVPRPSAEKTSRTNIAPHIVVRTLSLAWLVRLDGGLSQRRDAETMGSDRPVGCWASPEGDGQCADVLCVGKLVCLVFAFAGSMKVHSLSLSTVCAVGATSHSACARYKHLGWPENGRWNQS